LLLLLLKTAEAAKSLPIFDCRRSWSGIEQTEHRQVKDVAGLPE